MNAIESRRRSPIGTLGEPASIARPDPLAAPARDRRRGAGRRLAAGVLALSGTVAAVAGPETALANEPIALASLGAPVEVRIDPLGVPEIAARSRLDAFAAEGFVHGRDRLFQMDLMRRNAAGELAALLGPFVVDRDLSARVHARRDLARRILDRLPEEDRRLLRRYSDGVNAAIASIDMPPEYALAGWPPSPWRPEDSVLTALSMHEMLASNRGRELGWSAWRECLGEEMFEFLLCPVSRFDALLVEEGAERDRAAPIPGPAVFELNGPRERGPRRRPRGPGRGADAAELHGSFALDATFTKSAPTPGSNAFAVAGVHTADGRAILANDPHLGLSMPTLWYRIALRWPDAQVAGLSLPGMPGVIIGTNGRVAWGFTNLTGDFEDWIEIEVDPGNADRYRTPEGLEVFGERVESIEVRGGEPRELVVRTTRWGPVSATSHLGAPLVKVATIDDPDATNLALLELDEATNLDEALSILARWHGPPQNALVADANGRIGWTVTGLLPDRGGADGRTARSLAAGGGAFPTRLDESMRPRVVDPPSGVLFTANARPMPLADADRLGRHWAEPTRAHRIRELLAYETDGQGPIDESTLLAMQLDTGVPALEPWRDLVLDHLPPDVEGPLASLREICEFWNGRADEDERGPVVLNEVRNAFAQALLSAILDEAAGRCGERPDERFRVASDEPWLRLLEARPFHLLPPPFRSWDRFILATLVRVATLDSLRLVEGPGACPTWGERNELSMQHPMSRAMPFLSRGYDVPAHPQAGHPDAVRVAARGFGASARLVVGPGREATAILQTPGGQSGVPGTMHYRDRHEAWRFGDPEPLLPALDANDAAVPLRLVPE